MPSPNRRLKRPTSPVDTPLHNQQGLNTCSTQLEATCAFPPSFFGTFVNFAASCFPLRSKFHIHLHKESPKRQTLNQKASKRVATGHSRKSTLHLYLYCTNASSPLRPSKRPTYTDRGCDARLCTFHVEMECPDYSVHQLSPWLAATTAPCSFHGWKTGTLVLRCTDADAWPHLCTARKNQTSHRASLCRLPQKVDVFQIRRLVVNSLHSELLWLDASSALCLRGHRFPSVVPLPT